MKRLTYILILLLFTINFYSQNLPVRNGVRSYEIIKTSQVRATDYLQALLDDVTVTDIPLGYYYVPDSIIAWQNKQYDWNGSVLYSDSCELLSKLYFYLAFTVKTCLDTNGGCVERLLKNSRNIQ